MVSADCCACNYPDPGAFQGLRAATGSGSDYYGVGIPHCLLVNGPAVKVDYLRVRFKDAFEERDIGIGDYFHGQVLATTNIIKIVGLFHSMKIKFNFVSRVNRQVRCVGGTVLDLVKGYICDTVKDGYVTEVVVAGQDKVYTGLGEK